MAIAAAEVSSVRQNLPFRSLSSGYVKYKLWRTENTMERLAAHIRAYASKGKECASLYQRYDRSAAEKY